MAQKTRRLNWRLFLLILVLLFGAGGTVFRLVQVQILSHAEYAAQAESERLHRTVVREPRGAILDRNGFPLATTLSAFDIYIDPRSWADDAVAGRGAKLLAPLLERDPLELIGAVRAQEQGDYLAARAVDAAVGLAVLDQAPPGVKTVNTSRRYYPEGDLASTLLGFIGRDQEGLAGIEADFDRELGGVAAEVYYEQDGLGNPIPFGQRLGGDPEPGGDITLTIDRFVQRLVEEKLDTAIEEREATGGSIIVVEPETGEILAMASRPAFRLTELNLNEDLPLELVRNLTVTDMYPPGSLLKTITVAAAIDQGLVSAETTFFDSGTEVMGGEIFRNWDLGANGTVSVREILQFSLNTGAVWLSRQLGPERYYDYLQRFGFGETTHLGLGGEAAGLVRTNEDPGWCECDLATNSFGQGLGVTPLQVVAAVSSLVNGGLLMRPYIVKEVAGPDGPRTFEPVVVRRVVSEETAGTLFQLMNDVVEGVPFHLARVPGYQVGGKTGTSTFVDEPGTIASFVGFAPVEDPRFLMLVKIDQPQDARLGGLVAAPVFAELVPEILGYMGVPPADAAQVQGTDY